MKNLQFLTTASLAGMLVLGASSAQAALLIGNLDNGTVATQGNQVNGADNEFVSFKTPNDGITRTVDDISFFLSNSGLGTGIFSASFIWYNDSLPPSGDPTGVATTIPIGTQDVTVTAGSGTVATFVPSSTLTLLPNTLYGLRLNGTPGSGLTWLSRFTVAGDFDSTYASEVGATFNRAFRTNDGGANWTAQTSQRIFEINVSDVPRATPEPTAILGLLAVGLLSAASQANKKAH